MAALHVLLLVSLSFALGELAFPAGGQRITIPGPVFPIVADSVPEHHMPASPQAISSSDVTVLREPTASTAEEKTASVVDVVSALSANHAEAQQPTAASATPTKKEETEPHSTNPFVKWPVLALFPRIPSAGTRPLAMGGTRPVPAPMYGYQPMQMNGGYWPQETAPFGYPQAAVPAMQNPFRGTQFENAPFPNNPNGFPYVGTPMGLLGAFGLGTVPMLF